MLFDPESHNLTMAAALIFLCPFNSGLLLKLVLSSDCSLRIATVVATVPATTLSIQGKSVSSLLNSSFSPTSLLLSSSSN